MRAPIAAGVLALAVCGAGVRWGAMVAGGADSYGYVSQAGLWLQGLPIVTQDIVRGSPWPFAEETWSPLGYRPSPRVRDSVVPIYPPGLPLLMATLQRLFGYCGAFLVVPISGAAAIWLTFVLGRRAFGNDAVAFAGAVLVATSPVFLYQLMNAMSDVPVTAFFALALVLATGRRALAAGAAMSAVVAIRPNLAPLALAIGAWLALVDRRSVAWFALGLLPAIAGIAWVNAVLYESPFISGYGTAGEFYSLGYFLTNVVKFARSLGAVETPAVALAVVFLAAPRLFPPMPLAHGRTLVAAAIGLVFVSYVFYQPFDAWWYLRFLLPAWPMLMLATWAVVDAIAARVSVRFGATAAAIVLIGLAVGRVSIAASRSVFDLARGERRYVDVARFVAANTDADAVLFSVQHSGSLRWYADRLTLRFAVLERAWLDRSVEYLQSIGRHPYFVLDGDEVELFRRRFGAANKLGRLDWQPLATLGGVVTIYDPLSRTESPPLAIAQTHGARTWPACDAPQSWPPVRRLK